MILETAKKVNEKESVIIKFNNDTNTYQIFDMQNNLIKETKSLKILEDFIDNYNKYKKINNNKTPIKERNVKVFEYKNYYDEVKIRKGTVIIKDSPQFIQKLKQKNKISVTFGNDKKENIYLSNLYIDNETETIQTLIEELRIISEKIKNKSEEIREMFGSLEKIKASYSL
jgi:hypothetical protein